MNIKKILALALIVLALFSCLSVVSAGLFDFLGGDKYIDGDGSRVKIPSNFTIDDKKIVATRGDINISFAPHKSPDENFENDCFAGIMKFGNNTGYENITNKTVNGYTVHDYGGHPDKLKTIQAPTTYNGSSAAWIELTPQATAPFDHPVDHFRSVTFIKDGKEHLLLIYTNNSSANLYTSEFEDVINSIGPIENK